MNDSMIVRSGFKNKLSFSLGLTSTMPIVGIVLMGRDISFYRIIFFVILIICAFDCLREKKIRIKKYTKKLLLWLLEGFFACCIGWITLSRQYSEWSNAAFSYIPRTAILIIFALFWGSSKTWKNTGESVIQGFFVGCIINCLWALIDAAGFYIASRSINNIVFAGYIARNNIRYGTLSLIYDGTIRSGGFNYDPAQIGFIAPVVAGYAILKKKYWLLFLTVGAILASASTTALVSSVGVILLCINKGEMKKNTISSNKMVISVLTIIIMSVIIIRYRDYIISVATNSYNRFYGRISQIYLATNGETGNVRLKYLACLPYAIVEVFPYLIFGSGFGTASLGYSISPIASRLIGNRVHGAYDMENTYIAYLFDTGIVGMILFVSMLFQLIKTYRINESIFSETRYIIFSALLASALSFAFYHYILFAPQMLLFTIALSISDEEGDELA